MKLLALSLITFFILLAPATVFSQDFSQNTQKRLEEIQSKASTTSSKTATDSAQTKDTSLTFVEGVVSTVVEKTILINTATGSRIIYTTENTKFVNLDTSGKKDIGFGDIKVGETIMVVGLAPNSNSGSARLVVRDQVKQLATFSFFGKIATLEGTKISAEHFSSPSLSPLVLNLGADTNIKDGSGANLTASDLVVRDSFVAAGVVDEKGILVTKTILKLGSSSPKTATSSAR